MKLRKLSSGVLLVPILLSVKLHAELYISISHKKYPTIGDEEGLTNSSK